MPFFAGTLSSFSTKGDMGMNVRQKFFALAGVAFVMSWNLFLDKEYRNGG